METLELTPFDSLVSDTHLQIMKAAIPYIAIPQQRILSLYVKFLEFSNTYQLVHATTQEPTLGICSVEAPKRNASEMLNAVKHYCSDPEKELVDLITNFISAFQIYRSYQDSTHDSHEPERREHSSLPLDAIKGMLSPDQKRIFDTYSGLLAGAK
jgi:hypothetical protein